MITQPPLAYFKKTLFLLWITHLFVDFFTGIWPIYKTVMHIDIALAGLLSGISGFLGESLQLVFGYLSDRGHRKKILISGIVLASSVLWITHASSTLTSFLVLLLLMIGSGSFHPAAVGMAGSLSRIYKGRTILFFSSGGALGLAISQLAFTYIIQNNGGHATILYLPILGILALLLWHRFPDISVKKTALSLQEILTTIQSQKKPILLLYFSQVANQALIISFMFLLPDLLGARGCDSWLCLGGGHFLFIIGSALTLIPAGFLCDRYGHRNVIITVLSCSILLFFTFLGVTALPFWALALLLLILGGFCGLTNPIIVSWGHKLVPENPSTISAILMGFAWCVGNLGPVAAGYIAKSFQENGFVLAMMIMGSLLPLKLIFAYAMPKPVPETNSTVETITADS